MISNYFTIAAIARELNDSVVGRVVDQPYTQRRGELVIPFTGAADERVMSAIVSCEPSANFLVVKDRATRARKNSADVLSGFAGCTVAAVLMHPSDRQVAIVEPGGRALLLHLFGSRANVFLLDASGSIGAAFLRPTSSPNELPFPFPDAPSFAYPLPPPRSHEQGMTVLQWLKKMLPVLGPVLCREILHRISLREETPMSDVPENTLRSLSQTCERLTADLLERPSPRICYRDDEPLQFSLVSLSHLGEVREDTQPSVSIGILRYLNAHRRRDSFLSRKGIALGDIASTLLKKEHALRSVRETLSHAGDPRMLERFGKIIQLHLNDMEKGMQRLDVADPFANGGETVTIPLDPSLSPSRNAERYFEQSKRARTMKEESDRRLRTLTAEVESLNILHAALDEVSTAEDLEACVQEHRSLFQHSALLKTGVEREGERPPFRVFTVHGGFQVWVGKNSANNDLLTTRHTAKNDLWFHARGVGGSHVVLKIGTGKGEVSKRAKEQAAGIAAHFSKMKTSAHVPVSMCLGKFVRKPRGAAVGSVTIEREEVLFATPSLPDGEDPGKEKREP